MGSTHVQNVADLVAPDSNGKTFRQVNMEMKHNIPIGTLVEISYTGERLFVVEHTRDCDGTPMYSLGRKTDTIYTGDRAIFNKFHYGFDESSLIVIG